MGPEQHTTPSVPVTSDAPSAVPDELATVRRRRDRSVDTGRRPRPDDGTSPADGAATSDQSPCSRSELTAKVRQLEEALKTRTVIGQATGILMARHDVPADRAFTLLVETSCRANRKLRDVASALVDGAGDDENSGASAVRDDRPPPARAPARPAGP
ncbi:ANTAR domain-containing protein [Phycicoccus flavus]|uniref:ANTAR domain-containing protein n=1 Tax=Phycicoccus flavus TaxID=2502783 RepID=UPI000FEB79A4|nr:ANTAR domain-containing protein [Phycicoccus flavus]NHA67669.1 ANTAR domain-containing protein [Phycicoccus flavus]